MNKYAEMKQRHQKEINEFPLMFAFDNEQFAEGMVKLGLKPEDTDKIYSIGAGGFLRRTDSKAFKDMLDRFDRELKDAVAQDTTGEGFVYDMFLDELDNHEYGYTRDVEDTLDVLGFTIDRINEIPNLKHGLMKAIQTIEAREEDY